ncbi:metal-sensitive transcriptional regulator [Effusibacillus consociatus]|uniref:Metal-sensitive transcriptional regulator n=1 Tax=Effusibacillus consociatus TaxID=1117041 RepID=A0ABV9Q2X2_9BACL
MEDTNQTVYLYHDHKDQLLRNLRKIEGQVRGVQKMIEEDRYCVDILTQLAAIKAATNKIGLALLEDHTRGCVKRAIQNQEDGGDHHIEELMEIIRIFTK